MTIKRRKDNKNRILKEGEYQKANGSYEYRWRNKSGKRLSIYAPSLVLLREKQLEIQRSMLDGVNVDHTRITVNDLFERWKELKRGIKDNTFRNYLYMYNHFARERIGNYKLVDLKRSDVRGLYNNLYDCNNIKIRTLECLHTVLHQVLELGVEDEYLRYNPASNALRDLKLGNNVNITKRKSMTIEEQRIFENYLNSNNKLMQWRGVFTVMLWTGLRVGEVTGLRWDDIDFENNTISVNRTLVYYDKGGKGITFSVNTPKTEKSKRVIPMLNRVKEALIFEKKYQEDASISCNAVIDGDTNFIFVNRFGGVQHQGTLNKALKRIVRDCNYSLIDNKAEEDNLTTVPPISNHILRHSFTTRMFESGLDIKVVSDILGHSEIETTLNIYTSVSDDMKKDQFENFAKHAYKLNL